jgi:hypothetical protein
MWSFRGLTVRMIIIAALLSSCATEIMPTPSTHQPEPTQERQEIVEIPSITPTSTMVEPEYAAIEFNCLDILPALSENAELEGKLFLDVRVGYTSPPMLLDMKTREKNLLPELELDGRHYRLSPNHRLLAYLSFRTGNEQLVVMNADGQEQKISDWGEDWLRIAYWLDDNNLAIPFKRPESYSEPSTMLVMNIDSGEYDELIEEYPNIVQMAREFDWAAPTFYDPTLNRVAYIASGEKALGFVSWDLQEEEFVGQLFPWLGTFGDPKWSPNGGLLLTINDVSSEQDITKSRSEFFTMTYDGEVERITQFTTLYDLPRIGNFEWSPDSRYIAFWILDDSTDSYETLAVMDLEKNQIMNYCIPGNQWMTVSGGPEWSPNSQQVVVNNISEESEEISRVILVDINKEYAAVIAENLAPIAWLADSP